MRARRISRRVGLAMLLAALLSASASLAAAQSAPPAPVPLLLHEGAVVDVKSLSPAPEGLQGLAARAVPFRVPDPSLFRARKEHPWSEDGGAVPGWERGQRSFSCTGRGSVNESGTVAMVTTG